MSSYMNRTQGEEKSVMQYLVRVKTYLERNNRSSKLSNMNGGGLNHLSLVHEVNDFYTRQIVAKEAENWRTVEDTFNSISKHA